MSRPADPGKMAAIFQAVRAYPGERPGFFARLLGLPRSQITRSLPALEQNGYLLSEDERGGLWPFKERLVVRQPTLHA